MKLSSHCDSEGYRAQIHQDRLWTRLCSHWLQEKESTGKYVDEKVLLLVTYYVWHTRVILMVIYGAA